MSYIKTTKQGGNIKIISKHKRKRDKKEAKRIKRLQKTTEAQKIRNQVLAEQKLLILIHTNFTCNDYSLTLTYSDEKRPEADKAKNTITNFLRRLRRRYASYGRELKYIQVTEYDNKRIHHHMIINGIPELTISEIQSIWGNGLIKSTPLEKDGYYKELADYYIKETSKTFNTEDRIFGKRWNASRNLEQPEITSEEIPTDSDFEEIPLTDGEYTLVKESVFIGTDEFTGLPYVTYAMIKKTQRRR